MMASLTDIRILETRLHSHVLEWDDLPLQNELLFLLDELQEIHDQLDRCDVPTTDVNGVDLSLLQRVKCLVRAYLERRPSAQIANSYDVSDSSEARQFRLV
jgi:hypothetical protein